MQGKSWLEDSLYVASPGSLAKTDVLPPAYLASSLPNPSEPVEGSGSDLASALAGMLRADLMDHFLVLLC